MLNFAFHFGVIPFAQMNKFNSSEKCYLFCCVARYLPSPFNKRHLSRDCLHYTLGNLKKVFISAKLFVYKQTNLTCTLCISFCCHHLQTLERSHSGPVSKAFYALMNARVGSNELLEFPF